MNKHDARDDRYSPIPGGWQIRLRADDFYNDIQDRNGKVEKDGITVQGVDKTAGLLAPTAPIGLLLDNPRLHRRPLYPPADKSLLWNEAEREKLAHLGFRPLVLAYNAPRFLFELHWAGGFSGHLFVGLINADGSGKWLHEWPEITVRYVDGRMCYALSDPTIPGVTVSVEAAALSDSVGLILKVSAEGLPTGMKLVWAYGGASADYSFRPIEKPVYAPADCDQNHIELCDHHFTLTRAFAAPDGVLKEPYAVPHHLPGWKLKMAGGSTWPEPFAWGAPEAFDKSPAELLSTAESGRGERENRVAVQGVALPEGRAEGFILVGAGGNITAAIHNPANAWTAALARNQSIADRLSVQTPDPYLNAAATMMAFAIDGTWGDSTVMHGGWSWRLGFLGWRGWYGLNCLGWTERIRRAIQCVVKHGLIRDGDDKGAISSLLDSPGYVHYNMNEVFLDQVRQYFDYTDDRQLMREVFPVLKGILEWEDRRLQPRNEDLYENSLNTWISDAHWYVGGQCAQASAYMLGANTFMAYLAERLGENPAPFREKAARIRAAMQRKLWLDDRGVFAEYVDTRGHQMRHEQPELPTLYHTAEFGAADPDQIARMLDWAQTNLRWEETPGGGRQVWSSNWYPNKGRSYTHSTHELAGAEELNFALTHYLAGRADDAYALLRATLCGIYNGPTPGGLSCHCFADGRLRRNDEFSDTVSMWGRAVTEGLFGIVPHLPDGVIEITPQFPSDWREAAIQSPLISYTWQQAAGHISLTWKTERDFAVHVRIPLRAKEITSVTVNGQRAAYEVAERHGLLWVSLAAATGRTGDVSIAFVPAEASSVAAARRTTEARKPTVIWQPPHTNGQDLSRWTLVDLAPIFNATIPEALEKVTKEAMPPALPASQVGFNYWRDNYLGKTYHGGAVQPPSDDAWRAKVGPDGVAWTTDGIPFQTVK